MLNTPACSFATFCALTILSVAAMAFGALAWAAEPRFYANKGQNIGLFPEPSHPGSHVIDKGRVVTAELGGILHRAWYADGTERYPHGVLGDDEEAETLVLERSGKRYSFTLGPDAVFEDLEPRLADIDGDGTLEVIAIKSYLDRGATTALFGIRNGMLVALAEADPIGLPNRWLNPAGVADFDGDGKSEIAIIRTPHIGGILIHYDWDGGARLVAERQTKGYSTHTIGSTVLGMSATGDWDGDGVPDLFLPRQDRSVLAIVTAAGGGFRELASFRHPAPLDTRIIARSTDDGSGRTLLYGLRNGEVWQLPLPR